MSKIPNSQSITPITFFTASIQSSDLFQKKITANISTKIELAEIKKQQEQQSLISEKLLEILDKKMEERTNGDINFLNRYTQRSPLLKLMSKNLSLELSKNVIKYGKVKIYQKQDKVISSGTSIQNIPILLFGQLLVYQSSSSQTNDISVWTTLEILIQKLGKNAKKLKSWKYFDSCYTSQFQQQIEIPLELNSTQGQIISDQQILNHECLISQNLKYSKTFICHERATILFIDIKIFYDLLINQYAHQQNNVLKIFRQINIFDFFDNFQMKFFIQKLNLVEFKKNQSIYKQGDESLKFYFLIEGQIQITKTIDLFAENPNNFYQNRSSVSYKNCQRVNILPYANLKGVYNYRPQTKTINLAVINSPSIFGEEEIINNFAPRQVNAKVKSLNARMYQIGLDQIEQICIKNQISSKGLTIQNFILRLSNENTFKKILLRQNQLAQIVQMENKSNLNLLFQESSDKKKLKGSKNILRPKTNRTKKIQGDEAPPAFNIFNYTDLFEKNNFDQHLEICPNLNSEQKKITHLLHLNIQNPSKKQNQSRTIRVRNNSQTITSKKQNKIAIDSYSTLQNSHLKQSSKNQQFRLSRPSNSVNININSPLFALNYFKNQQKTEKRLKTSIKKQRLESIYKSQNKMTIY